MLFFRFLVLVTLSACNRVNAPEPPGKTSIVTPASINPYPTIGSIPLPAGYTRLSTEPRSFTAWLRTLPLKKSKTVFTYNGMPKRNQSAQFAVLDIPVGDKDLQQCADAVMRLRAEYLYAQKRFDEIDFADNNRKHYRLPANADRKTFDQFLEKVFSYCGTASLAGQLNSIPDFKTIKAGDILIKGGSPGHAMQVIDIAQNKEGQKIYLLAQSYMPAQDIHVVINPQNSALSPWYEATDAAIIETPEWTFYRQNLMKWPAEK